MPKATYNHSKLTTLLIAGFLCFCTNVQAQLQYSGKITKSSRSLSNKARALWKANRWDVNFGLGLSNYLGDVGGGNQEGSHYLRDLNIESTRWAISAGVRYKLTEILALHSNLTFGYVSGDDKLSGDFYRNNRNLSFRTSIFEMNTTFEVGLGKEQLGHRYDLKGVNGERAFSLNTYLFGGIGLFYFNPQAFYKGAWVDLAPLSTEGQGLPEYPTRHPYKQWQICFPIGIGFRYSLSRQFGVGLEYGYRLTFTDYIDDVSQTYVDQSVLLERKGAVAAALADRSVGTSPATTAAGEERGNPNYNDVYMFAVVSVHYKFFKGPYAKGRLLWY